MRLLRNSNPGPEILLAAAACVAHRCGVHKDTPPLNMAEGNGSSECGVCAAEEFGARLAEQALEIQDSTIIYPLLDGYADRLTHHALLMDKLREVRDRLMLAGVAYGDVDAVLNGNR